MRINILFNIEEAAILAATCDRSFAYENIEQGNIIAAHLSK
jgi:hypothetical protein